MKNPLKWKVFFILWIATIFSVIAVLPYSLELQSGILQNLELPVPLPALLALQVIQNSLLFGVLIAAGLFLAGRIGLGLPILESRLRGEPTAEQIRSIVPVSLLTGLIASLLIVGLELVLFQPMLLQEFGEGADALVLSGDQPAAWKGFFASFYGGIVEEILLRLFLMSLLAWLGSFVLKTTEGKPAPSVFWMANILAAIIFGIAHLPATATILPLTALVVTRAVVLNGVAGVAFGYLYWKRGLESAMLAHFSADLVLHVLLAL